jgi:hypothetical protein
MRAVSGDDYETLAAQTPGVSRARARWVWDGATQRSLVKVFVGDDEAAETAARSALQRFSDPNRPVIVERATPVYADLTFTLEVERDYDCELVSAAVVAALLDRRRRPFGFEIVGIEDIVYDSEIYDACLTVPGVAAVHSLVFRVPSAAGALTVDPGPRHVPRHGTFFLLRGDGLHVASEVPPHGR